jgi:hypothetical protein
MLWIQVRPFPGRSNGALWSTITPSVIHGGETYAVVFLSENGTSLVREFMEKFEAGKKMTVDARLGIRRGENLRMTDPKSLVMKFAQVTDSPPLRKAKKRKLT